jgi:hypothetical protein
MSLVVRFDVGCSGQGNVMILFVVLLWLVVASLLTLVVAAAGRAGTMEDAARASAINGRLIGSKR